ncbi:hypothetical protein Agabi119p4_967 [Agaricus bisporus var. burnettii]|uniref:Uncharacterized protein n=1 Tax=Agaricus bisporus var. burnettii TaxID=192524 RepID=A0A8H7FBL6_AGABI|nr:hypothetical protein Agabi119p4_967 [Agaricus bisporus var. burnettii]
MYSFLPDELLKEILAPALQVPDASFACPSGDSPFANYTPTTSGYLLVCKDWLRVATPLLYSVVVLRSKAQIQALESTLESTPVLGKFIKKLRIESGYCASLSVIFKRCAGSLTDFTLGLIKPKRLIIYDLSGKYIRRKLTNKKRDQFVEALREYIAKWDKLTIVTLPSNMGWNSGFPDFIDAICQSQTIEVVSVGHLSYFYDWMGKLSQSKSIKQILVKGNRKTVHFSVTNALKLNPKLEKLLHWIDEDVINATDTDFLDDNPSSLPSSSSSVALVKRNWVSDLPDTALSNVLFYAMGIDEIEQLDPFCLPGHVRREYQSYYRRKLVLVCKKFHKLALPLYYRSIMISSNSDVQILNVVFKRNKKLGALVKTSIIYELSHSAELKHNLTKFFSYTRNLRRVIANRLAYPGYTTATQDVLDWNSLSALAQKAGSRLMDLAIQLHRPSQPKSPDLFYQFKGLRWLDFSSPARFEFDSADVVKTALPYLDTITCSSFSNTFLLFMSCLNLPKIRSAHFLVLDRCDGAITFLRKHGSKLHTLELPFLPGISVFDVCSNLKKFIIPGEKHGYGVAEFFYSNNEHPLQEIHIKTSDVLRGAEKDKFRYLGGLDLSNFTSLSDIRVDRCVWPITEHEIKKDHWVAWAERLQELYEVNIVNSQGKGWRRRLQARREK